MESYYAHIENNIVTSVEVVTDEFFNVNPQGYTGTWKKVGQDSGRPFCGKGYIYLPAKDKIIIPQPYPSWTLNNNDEWAPLVSKPAIGRWDWDENILNWKQRL